MARINNSVGWFASDADTSPARLSSSRFVHRISTRGSAHQKLPAPTGGTPALCAPLLTILLLDLNDILCPANLIPSHPISSHLSPFLPTSPLSARKSIFGPSSPPGSKARPNPR